MKSIDTPEELLVFMDEHIRYGFVGCDGKKYTTENDEEFEEGCKTVWRLSTPDELIKKGYGHCWDQVEFERDWFESHGYTVKTLYIWFELDHENPYTTHTFLIYEKDDKHYLFEHADGEHRGIKKFDSYKDALYHQMENHLRLNNRIEPMGKDIVECLHIYEYPRPIYGLDFYEFIDFVLDKGIKIL